MALIPKLLEKLNLGDSGDCQIINQGIDFISSYADRYRARDLTKAMGAALADGDIGKLAVHLLDYAALLVDHIDKEDGVLFPWLNKRLSEQQGEALALRFAQADQALGNDGRRYQGFVERLEKRYLGHRTG